MVEKLNKTVLKNISNHLTKLTTQAIEKAFDIKEFPAVVSWSTTGTSDLSSPSALKLYNMNCRKEGWKFPGTKEVAEEIVKNLPKDDMIKEVKITQLLTDTTKKAKKEEKKDDKKDEKKDDKDDKKEKKKPQNKAPESYFIDFILSDDYLINLALDVLNNGVIVENSVEGRKALVDFSSPNIAKEMHVGHLRSTIIGEAICRVLEFLKVDVMRVNHVGDWGTQFGMLIANLEEEHPDYLTNKPEIKELEAFYVQAKKKFDNKDGDKPDFKKKAYENTVKLQTGDEKCREAWQFICQASRNEFEKIYKRLNINVTECGESFYDPLCRKLIPELEKSGKVILDDGAKIMKLDGMKVPLMVVKSDGGFTYDTTDLAAVKYRLEELKRDWIIYVIGNEQDSHVKAIAQAAKQLGLHNPPKTRIDHMGFGLILNEEGKKIATRDGGLVKLIDLLDNAKLSAKAEMEQRFKTNNVVVDEEELEMLGEKIGYSAVKYYDLKQTREGSYKFSEKFILDPRGNTAVYLFYNYVRICSLEKKMNLSKEDIEKIIKEHKITISHEKERALLISLLKFNDVIDEVVSQLALNKLADYIYIVCVKFSEFFDECRIKDNENEKSRILLVELTKRMLDLSFNLLGLTPVERI